MNKLFTTPVTKIKTQKFNIHKSIKSIGLTIPNIQKRYYNPHTGIPSSESIREAQRIFAEHDVINQKIISVVATGCYLAIIAVFIYYVFSKLRKHKTKNSKIKKIL